MVFCNLDGEPSYTSGNPLGALTEVHTNVHRKRAAQIGHGASRRATQSVTVPGSISLCVG